jgi:ATP-dependent RNA helicase RhlE
MKFSELNLVWPLLKALEKQGFVNPTQIQEKSIPMALERKDILGSAQTWSWKTLAFWLPILNNMYLWVLAKDLPDWKVNRLIKTLVIAPTRELAIQIWENLAPLCTNTNFKHTVIYWGKNQFHQVKALEKWVDILIATPGRLEDLISQWFIKLSYVEYLVLDEVDIMLDMGFMPDIKKVYKRLNKSIQTFLFSATIPKKIRDLAWEFLKNPVEISVHKEAVSVANIEEHVYNIANSNRRKLLQYLVKQKQYKSIIIFVKTKNEVEFVFEYIKAAKVHCDCIHRWKTQNQRQKALKSLKDWNIKVLVATDIASRGLDINDLSLVINYNIPRDPETYVHRIWRTGRAGKNWISVTFCIKWEKELLDQVENLIGHKIKIETSEEYKKEVIVESKIMWYSNFDEKWKEKFKKKTRKSFRIKK